MIGKKKLSDVRRELTELLERLPKDPPGSWLEHEIQVAEGQPGRDVETLKMFRSVLQRSGKKKCIVPVPIQTRKTTS
jgi:hypothetical protein